MRGHRSGRLCLTGLGLAGLSLAALATAAAVKPEWREVSLASPDGTRLTIGAARLGTSLIGAALAQDAQTVVLENLVLELGVATYRIPRLTFEGTSLDRAGLTSLFAPSTPEPLAERLARLTAKQASAPEIFVEQAIGPERQTTRYRNVTATDLNQGRIASLAAEAAAMEVTGGPNGTILGTLGRVAVSDLDLTQAARVYTERGDGGGERSRIYGAFSLENLELRTDKDAEITVSRVAGRDFMARATKNSLMDTIRVLAAERPDEASPAEQARLLGAAVEILDAMAVGSLEAVGIEFRDPAGGDAIGRIQRIAYASAAGAQPADARIEGLEIAAKDGRARIGTIALTGFSFGPTIEGLKELAERPLAEVDASALRKLIPTLGTLRVTGLEFDVPSETPKGSKPEDTKPENIRFGVKDVELNAGQPVNGIPTDLRVAVHHVTFEVPAGTTDEGLKTLAALGYEAVDLSWTTAASWNEPGNELVLREVSVRGAEMGSVVLRGVLGNVGRDVFDPDSALAMVALVGATAKSLELTVENGGLVERVIAREAKRNRSSAEKLRREYGMAAAVGVPTLLGGSASAKAIGQAIARFIAKPGRLSLSARTKDAGGLGLADMTSFDQLDQILDRLEVTARAE